MYAPLCICALVPRIEARTRLLLLVHYREARKPTNTGLLAARALVGSRVGIIGDRAQPLPAEVLAPEERAVLLYPAADAVPISALPPGPPITLVVPDGNWRQAQKMGRRVPGLEALPRVTLGDASVTEYHLRAEPQAEGLATLEAIARAYRTLEGPTGPAIEAALLAIFRVMVSRTFWLRGTLSADQVVGGLPPGVTRDSLGNLT